MPNEFKGFDELMAKFKELQDISHINFEDLFPDDFMQKNSNSSNLNDFLKNSGFIINSKADFEAIPDEEWEKYIIENTRFSSWSEMQNSAHEAWLKKWLKDNNLS